MKTIKNQHRQGDVLLDPIKELPSNLKKMNTLVIAYGETTGHKHRFDCKLGDGVELLEDEKGTIYVKVTKKTNLVHEEHPTQTIEPSLYVYRPQYEYDDEEEIKAAD